MNTRTFNHAKMKAPCSSEDSVSSSNSSGSYKYFTNSARFSFTVSFSRFQQDSVISCSHELNCETVPVIVDFGYNTGAG